MYKIYFKNIEEQYSYPVIIDDDKLYSIIAKYWKFVPNLMVTDWGDCSVLEIKSGEIIHPFEQKDEIIERLNKIQKSASENIENLIENLNKKIEQLQKKYDLNLEDEINDININILALSAKNKLELSEYGYRNPEMIVDVIKEDRKILYVKDVFEILDTTDTIVLMPVDRIHFEGRPFTHNCMFFPPKSVDFSQVFNVEKSLFGNGLRDVSRLTLFSEKTLCRSYCVAFNYNLDWDKFASHINHNDDITLLSLLSLHMNSLFDLIKFNECKFSLPDTLPGVIGSWQNSGDYLGALLYNKEKGAYIISGSVETNQAVKGVGLEITSFSSSAQKLIDLDDLSSEVTKIIKYALYLYSDALYSHNLTIKFIRIMTLFEYLAFPEEYRKFQDVKKYIICCVAKNKTEYNSLSNRFKDLSKDYRTEIIHNGKSIENLITDYEERIEFFDELEIYLKKTINVMFQNKEKTWEEFTTHRNSLIYSLTN